MMGLRRGHKRFTVPLDPTTTLRFIRRLVKRVVLTPGAPPGSIVHPGPPAVHPTVVRTLSYGSEGILEEEEGEDREALRRGAALWAAQQAGDRDSQGVVWVDVEGVTDAHALGHLAELTGIHPLVMEDIIAVGQRPKLDEYDDYLFLLLRMLRWNGETRTVEEEQVGLVLGRGCLFTFREHPGDLFRTVRARIETGKGRIRKAGADYLAYALMDFIVDCYFEVLEQLGEEVEQLEESILRNPGAELMASIGTLKRELLILRRSVWPLREVLASLQRVGLGVVDPDTRPYLRDTYDHVVHVMDTVDALRDVTGGTMDLYVSTLSQKTNEVMKVLTVIASIFIPLSFIAGVYGMNFHFMPELEWWWAYPAVLLLMFTVGVGMVAYFRLRRWI